MVVHQTKNFGARFVGWLYDTYGAAFRALPVERASALGGAIVRTLGPRTRYHHVARTNLRLAFPDLSPDAERGLLAEQWDNFGRLVGEFPHLDAFAIYDDEPRIEVAGAERLDTIINDKKGAVLISGHFANWEVMAMAIVHRGVPCRITYRPANNYFIDKRIIDQRTAYGIKLHASKGREGGMSLLRALAKGDAIALMNDQKYNEGIAVPFFGEPAYTADGPTRLARKYNCPLIPMSVRRLPHARFRVTVHRPIPHDTAPNENEAVANTVLRINQFVEDRIREAPAEWFWVHRRWPKPLYKRAKR